MRPVLRWSILPLAALLLGAAPSPTPSPSPAPTPISISGVISEADKASSTLADIQTGLDSDALSDNLAKFVPKLKREIDTNEAATTRLLASSARIEAIQKETTRWSLLRDDAAFWTTILNEKFSRLDHQDAQVAETTTLWSSTQAFAKTQQAPADLMNRIAGVLEQAQAADDAIDAKRNELLRFQGRLADQSARINQTLAALARARGEAVDRLLVRDHPPLWAAIAAERHTVQPAPPGLRDQLHACADFLHRERGKIVLHLAAWGLLVFAFRRARTVLRQGTASRQSTQIFDVPVSAATLLSLWCGLFLYSAAPPLFLSLLSAALVVPLLLVLRHLIERPLLPICWALALFFLSAQARAASDGVPLLSRLILLFESLAGLAFAFWLLRVSRFAGEPEEGHRLLWQIVGLAARAALPVFLVVAVANGIGYVNLALFVGTIFLQCAFAGLLLYAACHILDGLITFAFTMPPLALLAMVRHHRLLLERRLARFLRILGVGAWILFALDKMSLLDVTFDALRSFFALPLVAQVTAGSLTAFLLTLWASFVISRFVRFLLEEDVYRRVRLKAGLPFAISTLLHYAILLLGFYLAMAALMGDISKFTVLAGAFGVGLAFGLQNIVNNFVSSLIVLFERPVKIGDRIEIGPLQGTVRQIGIRATIIRTSEGSEIIIPNAKLISDPVTNWTLTNHQRLLEMDIVTANAGVSPEAVLALLETTAAAVPGVAASPAPEAVLAKFTAASLTFELRLWTSDLPQIALLRSRLAIALNKALTDAGIPVV